MDFKTIERNSIGAFSSHVGDTLYAGSKEYRDLTESPEQNSSVDRNSLLTINIQKYKLKPNQVFLSSIKISMLTTLGYFIWWANRRL